jgi:hypothetical protein
MYKKYSDYVIPNQGSGKIMPKTPTTMIDQEATRRDETGSRIPPRPSGKSARKGWKLGYFEQGDGVRYVERRTPRYTMSPCEE